MFIVMKDKTAVFKKQTKSVLKLENVWKTYDLGDTKVHAVKGISIDIKKGEFVSIIGSSGSGKSTTLNIIGALDKPSKGKVFLDGVDIAPLKDSKLARLRGKKIGFIFQTFNLNPNLSVYDNIALPMKIHEFPKQEIKQKVSDLIKLVGLNHRVDHLPRQLSGGERQRIAIARALSTEPAILLADEPTGNLDSKTGFAIMDLIVNLHKQGKTIILVTHESGVADYANRKIVLKDGEVVR
jgi:putative ABC transport system ATP-binding protein